MLLHGCAPRLQMCLAAAPPGCTHCLTTIPAMAPPLPPVCAERAGKLVQAATEAGALAFLKNGVLDSVPMQARGTGRTVLAELGEGQWHVPAPELSGHAAMRRHAHG